MNISEVIKNRTSLRVYDDRMIEDQDLEKILEAASLAPTAGNQQLYSIIVIKSQETKDKLSESCDHQPFIAKAPVLLLFVSDQKKWFDYYQLEGCKEFSERDILENYEFHKELFDLPDYVVPISLVCLGYYKEGHKRVHRKRFDQKYVVFEEKYRELSDEELKEMFAERAAGFVKTPTSSAENFAQAFYRRKTGAAFSKEMKRSVRAMLADYTKESC